MLAGVLKTLRIERRGHRCHAHASQNAIDGRKVSRPPRGGSRRSSTRRPASRSAELPLSTAAEVDAAVAAAKKAAPGWGATPPLKRASYMFRFKELLDQHADEIAARDLERARQDP